MEDQERDYYSEYTGGSQQQDSQGPPPERDYYSDYVEGKPENYNNILKRSAAGAKEPYPYLNFLPGGKKFNQDAMDATNYIEEQYPGHLKADRGREFLKEMGGSVALGAGAGSLAAKIPGLAGGNMLQEMARGAISGASGAQAFKYEDAGKRAGATAFGAGIGGLVPPVATGIGKVAGAIGKAPKAIMNVFKSAGELKDVESNIGQADAQIGALKESKIGAKNKLMESARSASESAKGPIKEAGRAGSDIYGETLDEVESKMAESGQKLSKAQYLEQVIKPTINEAMEMGIPPDSPSLQKIRSIGEKLAPPPPAEPGAPETDLLGMLTKTDDAASTFDDSLDFNDIRNYKNSVYKKYSSGVKAGSGPRGPEDLAADIYLKNHGQYLGSQSEEVAAMNKEYGPFANAKKWAYKTFRPGRPEEVQKGANVLKRVAEGNYNQDDLNYLESLEKGSGRFPGTGKLRGDTPSMAQKIRDIDGQIKTLEKSKVEMASKKSELVKLRRIRDDIIRWGTVSFLGGTGYAFSRGAGNVLTHSTE